MKPTQLDIQLLISRTLRWGVSIACLIALVGGVIFLFHHGSEPFDLSQYQGFSYHDTKAVDFTTLPAYTTLRGIAEGFFAFTPIGWIQMGVLVLILTPILRVALSLFDFLRDRDWLYSAITAIVLAVIISNSIEGFK